MLLFLLAALLSMPSLAADLPLVVEDSGSKEVDKLVLQLVSTHPNGYSDMTWQEEMAVPYMTTQVSNALVRLNTMGPGIFPALVRHLRDDRYSFSVIVAAWDNLTVGDAVVEVLCDDHETFSGYKIRKTPSGSAPYLSFKDYLRTQGAEQWADRAKSKTRLEILLEFIDWCFAREEERGFTGEVQREGVLHIYKRARDELRTQYSKPRNSVDKNPPAPFETNSTSSHEIR